MTWTDVTIGGAFVAGCAAGAAATIRVMRWLLDYLRDEAEG